MAPFEGCERVYFYSDEEGTAPFRDFDGGDSKTQAFLPGLVFEGGIITGLEDGTGLVFLGDLIDHAPNELRLLGAMLKLKQRHPERVVLIGGNRDVDKLRLTDECVIVGEDAEDIVTEDHLSTFDNLLDLAEEIRGGFGHKFKFKPHAFGSRTFARNAQVPPPSDGVGVSETLEGMYNSTMGSPEAIKSKIEEYQTLGVNMDFDDPELKCILVALMNMIAAGRGVKTLNENLPTAWSLYTREQPGHYLGVHMRYLQQCDILNMFDFGGKTVLVSHAGVPASIACPLGLPPPADADAKPGAKEVIECINREFKEAVALIDESRDRDGDEDTNRSARLDLVAKYVFLAGAGNSVTNEDGRTISSDEISPIVGYVDRPAAPKYAGGATGGAWFDGTARCGHSFEANHSVNPAIDFSVYGHRPQGPAPTVWRTSGTTYVCVDVSKMPAETHANGIPNPDYRSFAFFRLSRETEGDGVKAEVLGRTRAPRQLWDKLGLRRRTPAREDRHAEYTYDVASSPGPLVEGYEHAYDYKYTLGGRDVYHRAEQFRNYLMIPDGASDEFQIDDDKRRVTFGSDVFHSIPARESPTHDPIDRPIDRPSKIPAPSGSSSNRGEKIPAPSDVPFPSRIPLPPSRPVFGPQPRPSPVLAQAAPDARTRAEQRHIERQRAARDAKKGLYGRTSRPWGGQASSRVAGVPDAVWAGALGVLALAAAALAALA